MAGKTVTCTGHDWDHRTLVRRICGRTEETCARDDNPYLPMPRSNEVMAVELYSKIVSMPGMSTDLLTPDVIADAIRATRERKRWP